MATSTSGIIYPTFQSTAGIEHNPNDYKKYPQGLQSSHRCTVPTTSTTRKMQSYYIPSPLLSNVILTIDFLPLSGMVFCMVPLASTRQYLGIESRYVDPQQGTVLYKLQSQNCRAGNLMVFPCGPGGVPGIPYFGGKTHCSTAHQARRLAHVLTQKAAHSSSMIL